jgi:zinc transport system substrate-binding protein
VCACLTACWSILTIAGCGPAPEANSRAAVTHSASPAILTTFYPTAYFAQRIIGNLVPVECPVPDDADPIFWQPDAATIVRYQQSPMIIVNGAEYEKWIANAALPLTRVVDTSRVFERDFIRFAETTHSHGASGPHSHTGTDGHTWMDPLQATRQAEQIRIALARRWPEHDAACTAGFQSLAADLASLDTSLRELAPVLKTAHIWSSHPAYGYLARRYGLSIASVSLPPESLPDVQVWQQRAIACGTATTAESGPRVMLFESEPLPEISRRLKSDWNVTSVVFAPCETLSHHERSQGLDYMTVMRANIERLRAACSGPSHALR